MTPEEIQIQLGEIETRIDRLRGMYEQYFIGIDKLEPYIQKKDVERRFEALRKVQIRNTALRFRFQVLLQRYTTYLTYWQRICRQIEEGTFKREIARVQRYGRPSTIPPRRVEPDYDELEPVFEGFGALSQTSQEPSEKAAETNPGVPPTLPPPPPPHLPSAMPPVAPRRGALSPFGAPQTDTRPPASFTAPPPRAAAVNIPRPPPIPASILSHPHRGESSKPATASVSVPPPLPLERGAVAVKHVASHSDESLQAIYERYREARLRNGEPEVSFESVARQVRNTLPRLLEQFRNYDVTLDIVVKNGKTVLRPVLRPK